MPRKLRARAQTIKSQAAGVSNPEISDLTHKQPHPHCHDAEEFVPGEDLHR
jgi:hypothetical protein